MKVLFDANVPAKLRRYLPGHEVTRAQERGWQLLKNGALLDVAEADGFDLFLTGDKNLSYQQNLQGRKIALVVLPNIDWKVLREDTPSILAAVNRATRGSFDQLTEPVLPRRESRSRATEP